MNLHFYKYEGTGNDFVMIDNRTKTFPKKNTVIIAQLCNRNFGVGADGVILIENDENTDFKITYYNPDATQTFCGNGGRCAVAFAKKLGLIENSTTFTAFDGLHFATIKNNNVVSLQMTDVHSVTPKNTSVFVDTGTPHHVELVDDLTDYPVYEKGKAIRYNVYGEKGSNVNFVQQLNNNTFRVRTYEKGVENETLACGTGVTAVAIAMHSLQKTKHNSINLPVEGGALQVTFSYKNGSYTNVFLIGEASFVFEGTINFDHIDT